MNRKKKPTEEVKMSTWEVFRRLVRDAKPIYGWLLLGALLGGIVVACTVIAPKLLGQGIQLLYDAWAGERPKAGLTEALLPICGALAGVYLLKSIVDIGKMVLMNNVVSKYYTCTLRIKLSDKLSRLPISFIDKTPAGQIIDRIQEDVSNMGGSIPRHCGCDSNGLYADRGHRCGDAAGKLADGTGGPAADAAIHRDFFPDFRRLRHLFPPLV